MEGRLTCPKCGGIDGYTGKDYFSGWAQYMADWAGTYLEYPQLTDTVQVRRKGKAICCLNCGKRISITKLGRKVEDTK